MSDKGKISTALRQIVWNTYIGVEYGIGKCFCCGFTQITQSNFHCGHIKPKNDGGATTVDNLVPICGGCNTSMGDTNMNIFIDGQHIPRIPLDIKFTSNLNTFANDMFTDFRIHYKNKLDNSGDISKIDGYDKQVDISNVDKNDKTKGSTLKNNENQEATQKGPPYKCNRCKKKFIQKTDFTRHMNRKFPCPISKNKNIIKCKYCNKQFMRKDSLKRHISYYCPYMKNNNENDESSEDVESIINVDNENIDIESTIKVNNENVDVKLLEEKKFSAETNKILAYNNEDKTLETFDIVDCLMKGDIAIVKLFEFIHYNKNKPENHNIYISNNRSGSISIFNGIKWEIKMLRNVIDDIFNKYWKILIEMKNEFKKNNYENNYKKVIDEFEIISASINESLKRKKNIIAELKCLMYNNRDIVIKIKKDFDNRLIN